MFICIVIIYILYISILNWTCTICTSKYRRFALPIEKPETSGNPNASEDICNQVLHPSFVICERWFIIP